MKVNNTISLLELIQSNLKHLQLFFIDRVFFSSEEINSMSLLNFISTDDRIPFPRGSWPILQPSRTSSPRCASIVAKIHGWRRKHLPQNVRIFVKCTFEGPCFSFRYCKSSIVKDTWKCSVWSKGRLMKTTKWLCAES